MILISHPRSGSDWFLSCLKEPFSRSEIFGGLNDLDDSPFKAMTPSAKISYLRHMPIGRSQKIHAWDFMHQTVNIMTSAETERFIRVLGSRKDLYLMRRRNLKAAIRSYLIAVINDRNFHGKDSELTQSRDVTFSEVLLAYQGFESDLALLERTFEYKEIFVFEDLLSGVQVPQTVDFDRSRSEVKERRSAQYCSCIRNYEQFEQWLHLLKVPGQL